MKFYLSANCAGLDFLKRDPGAVSGVEHSGPDAYRKDGDDDPHSAEHGIVYCLTGFQRILDALIIAVKPSVVRFDGACLNDEEGQASCSRWNHHMDQKKKKEKGGERENINERRPKKH